MTSTSNPLIDKYLRDGCMRCKLGATLACKVNLWQEELQILRNLALESGLKEELKWSVPCYTFQNKNVVMIAAFKEFCSISFFKGSLLQDDKKLLEKAGPNTQGSRLIRFRNSEEIIKVKESIKNYLKEAIELEKQDKKPEYKKQVTEFPEELMIKMNEDKAFEQAFKALSPGRQRGYILHFSSAKQSGTRMARIEANYDKILKGEGIHDAYKNK